MRPQFETRARDVKSANGDAPPHDLDAEAAVLSAVILKPTEADDLGSVLREEDFFSPANRRVWSAVVALSGASQAVDVVAIATWLKDRGWLHEVGGVAYLARIIDAAPAVANIGAYAHTVTRLARLRATIRAAQTIAAEGYSAREDVDRFIERAEASISAIARDGGAQAAGANLMADGVRATFQDMEDRAKGLVTAVKTGFADLDWILVGETKEMHIVGARPGMGKTSFAMNVGVNVASGSEPAGVVLFSLEMGEIPVVKRTVASEARVDLSDIRRGRLGSDDWARLTQASQRLSRLPLAIDVCPGISVTAMRSRFRTARAKIEAKFPGCPVRLVIVDYLQLMGRNPNSNAGNREQEIAEISRGLTQFAMEEDVLVIALSQLNRSVESRSDKRPGMADLRESGALEQDATAILFLYRDDQYDPHSKDAGKCEVIIGKSRNGATGKVMLGFEKRFTRFASLEER